MFLHLKYNLKIQLILFYSKRKRAFMILIFCFVYDASKIYPRYINKWNVRSCWPDNFPKQVFECIEFPISGLVVIVKLYEINNNIVMTPIYCPKFPTYLSHNPSSIIFKWLVQIMAITSGHSFCIIHFNFVFQNNIFFFSTQTWFEIDCRKTNYYYILGNKKFKIR